LKTNESAGAVNQATGVYKTLYFSACILQKEKILTINLKT